MEIILFGLFGLLCLLLTALFGCMTVGAYEHKGRRALVRQTVIATVIAAGILIIPALIFGFNIYSDRTWPLTWGVLGGCAAGMFLGALTTALTAPQRIREHLESVPLVAPFALSNFNALDVDNDKVLSDGDLGHALMQTAFATAEDQKVVSFIRSNIDDIGHGVGSYTRYNGTTASSKTVSVISPSDLEAYKEKTYAKYAAWLQ